MTEDTVVGLSHVTLSRRFWVVLAAACCFATLAILYGRPLLIQASARVHVQFRATVDAATRATLERRFSLEPVEQVAPDTWRYELTEFSTENVAGLVRHEDVSDTQYIDRRTFLVERTAPDVRRPGRLGRYWPALAYRVVDLGPRLLVPVTVVALIFAAWPQLWAPTRPRRRLPRGPAALLSSLAFGAVVAACVTLAGSRDLENYEHSFFSLDRGTKVETVKVLGQPAYTLGVGLGVRLPLHGNLSASPAAMLAPYLPEPLTYWLLLTLAIGSATCVVRHAVAPLCGRLLSWVGACLLFCSLPIVTYTIVNDWPETAVTYCAFVTCVFAPHALLAVAATALGVKRRVLGGLGLLGLSWGAVALSHPGYWSQIAMTLTVSAALASVRTEHPLRTRLVAVAGLGATAMGVVALLAPDVLREMWVAGDMLQGMKRLSGGPEGSLWESNVWVWRLPRVRAPFTFLLLTVTSLGIGVRWADAARRRLILGSGLASLALGLGAAHFTGGVSPYVASTQWGLRDPAIAFAVLGAAGAAGVLAAHVARHVTSAWCAGIVLLACGLLGPVIAARTMGDPRALFDSDVAPRGMTPQQGRIFTERGLDANHVAVGSRLALWPGVIRRMRNGRMAQADFPDAGYVLVTATVKQRTMRQLVGPGLGQDADKTNTVLFNQGTSLPLEVLCRPSAVRFLQLNYLLAPLNVLPRTGCHVWQAVTPARTVDGWLVVHTAGAIDSRVRALPSAAVSDAIRREPALGSSSVLLSALAPLGDTSVSIGPRDVVIRQGRPSSSAGLTLVVPIAYDSAWTASHGRLENIGGLLALTAAHEPRVRLAFTPDMVVMLRSVAISLSQLFTCLGLLGCACVAPGARPIHPREAGPAD